MSKLVPVHGRDHRPGGADPIPGIGGLSIVDIQESFSSTATSISNGSSSHVASDAVSGTSFFNFFGSFNSCAITGIYSVICTVQLASTPWTAGGGMRFTLQKGSGAFFGVQFVTFPTVAAVANQFDITAVVTLPPISWTAGDQMTCNVTNFDGSATRDFQIDVMYIVGYG